MVTCGRAGGTVVSGGARQLVQAPTDLGGVELSSEPAGVTGGPHGIDVFYRGPNSHLWTSWWPDHQEVSFGARLRT
jgi:hypothetical protein